MSHTRSDSWEEISNNEDTKSLKSRSSSCESASDWIMLDDNDTTHPTVNTTTSTTISSKSCATPTTNQDNIASGVVTPIEGYLTLDDTLTSLAAADTIMMRSRSSTSSSSSSSSTNSAAIVVVDIVENNTATVNVTNSSDACLETDTNTNNQHHSVHPSTNDNNMGADEVKCDAGNENDSAAAAIVDINSPDYLFGSYAFIKNASKDDTRVSEEVKDEGSIREDEEPVSENKNSENAPIVTESLEQFLQRDILVQQQQACIYNC